MRFESSVFVLNFKARLIACLLIPINFDKLLISPRAVLISIFIRIFDALLQLLCGCKYNR